MKYCTNCGSQLSDTDKFCSKCGQSTSQSSNDSVKGRPPAPVKKTPLPGRYITKIEESNISNLSPPQKWNYNCVGCNRKVAVNCSNCENRYLIDNGPYLVCKRCKQLNFDFMHTCERNDFFEQYKMVTTKFNINRDRFFSHGNNKGVNKGGQIILIVLIVLIFAIFSFATRNT